ncbi:MAG: PQQ-dependent sugar dehydrogenase [Planctomycetes bacterium]|nr:PQQ-dependent sugar dehydrogenase [Planctomycetota bacterium]
MFNRTRTLGLALITSMGISTAALAGAGIEPLTKQLVASGLDHTVAVTHAPGDYKRLYIVEKQGRIKVLNLITGALNPSTFMNIDSLVGGGTSTNNEQGLLGLAFHPNWQVNSTFFVYYTNNSGNTVVSKYTAATPDQANATGDIIFTYSQPFGNHNGGWLGFGPLDGYLYISMGDGGSAGDPNNRAQTITNQLLGKMLRVDVNGDDFPADPNKDYAIPPNNPFASGTGDDEIWAYGLRNAWRCSFDRVTGDLYIGDVGQGAWEEIDLQRGAQIGGQNYGWRCREGAHNYNFSGSCSAQFFTEPIYEYNHGFGSSLTGGHVYRGCAIPTLTGTYFLADYNSAQVVSFTYQFGLGLVNLVNRTSELSGGGTLNQISTFGEDARGEMYVVDQGSGISGQVFRIVPVTPTIAPEDIDCSGDVGFSDILAIIGAWGPCDGCLEDLNGNGMVGFDDILIVIGAWG